MNVPPPPPPPPPSAPKVTVPVNNKALLSSIQKGTKLKKVPESLKNDRSAALGADTTSKNGPLSRPINGGGDTRKASLPQNVSNIRNELASQIMATANMRKQPVSNAPVVRPAIKSSIPAPNQFTTATNKPPPPPPLNRKPNMLVKNNSISESSRQQSMVASIGGQHGPPPAPTAKKPQPSLVSYQHYHNSNNPAPRPLSTQSVTRVTSNPPPPLPNCSSIDHKSITPPQHVNAPPPVPQRNSNQAPSPPQPPGPNMSTRSSSYIAASQYKVFDRPPPPPIPPTAFVNQRSSISSFDRRFTFPDERYFPSLR